MSNFDDKIRAAFAADPDIEELGKKESLLEQSLGTLRGQERWLNVMVVIVMFVFMGVLIWAVVRFVDAETTKAQIMWAAIFGYSSLAIGMFKLWFWMLMNRNSVIREVKRLELQVAIMAQLQREQQS